MRQYGKMADKITREYAAALLPQRPENSHKGTFGKVLNIAGSLNYQGAAYLSSIAALKSGAGYVSLASIQKVADNVAAKTPDITFIPLRDSYNQCVASDAFSEIKEIINGYNIISMGSGLSDKPAAIAFIDEALKYLNETNFPVVLDADALNAISHLGILKLPSNSIITPHPKELSRLIDVPAEEIQNDRVQYAKFAAQKFGSIVVLKGHETVIVSEDEIFINTTGNSALAKAGSGDVLTGMIAGFAAQGLSLKKAAILGVFLHGLSGELASQELTEYSVLASDILKYIPIGIKQLLTV